MTLEIWSAKGLVNKSRPAVAKTERLNPQEVDKLGSINNAKQIVIANADKPCFLVPLNNPSSATAPIKDARTTLGSVLTRSAKRTNDTNPMSICLLRSKLNFWQSQIIANSNIAMLPPLTAVKWVSPLFLIS